MPLRSKKSSSFFLEILKVCLLNTWLASLRAESPWSIIERSVGRTRNRAAKPRDETHFFGASWPDYFPPDRFALRRSCIWLKTQRWASSRASDWQNFDLRFLFKSRLPSECKFSISRSAIAHIQNLPIGPQRVGSREKWRQRLTGLNF